MYRGSEFTLDVDMLTNHNSGDAIGEPYLLTGQQGIMNEYAPDESCVARLEVACPRLRGLGRTCLACAASHIRALQNSSSPACLGEVPSQQFRGGPTAKSQHFFCGTSYPSFFVGSSPIAEYCVDYLPVVPTEPRNITPPTGFAPYLR